MQVHWSAGSTASSVVQSSNPLHHQHLVTIPPSCLTRNIQQGSELYEYNCSLASTPPLHRLTQDAPRHSLDTNETVTRTSEHVSYSHWEHWFTQTNYWCPHLQQKLLTEWPLRRSTLLCRRQREIFRYNKKANTSWLSTKMAYKIWELASEQHQHRGKQLHDPHTVLFLLRTKWKTGLLEGNRKSIPRTWFWEQNAGMHYHYADFDGTNILRQMKHFNDLVPR